MTLTENIRQAFCQEGRQPLVAIDAEDIDALIGDGENVRLVTLTGDSVAVLVSQLKAVPQLPEACKILFELIVAPGYEFTFDDLAPLSECLAALPTRPEIVWGCSCDPQQPENLRLNIIIIT